jgi:hypothetical protein
MAQKPQRTALNPCEVLSSIPNIAASLRNDFLPIATIAEIPPENVDAFLMEFAGHFSFNFHWKGRYDGTRQNYETTIGNFRAAINKLLRAVNRMEKCGITDPFDDFYNSIVEERWPERYDGRAHPSLSDLKRELDIFLSAANFLSSDELPKRGEGRTKIFLGHIWLTADKFGGKLTYDNHSNCGTLTEVIAFLRNNRLGPPIEDLSPATLNRLRPRQSVTRSREQTDF